MAIITPRRIDIRPFAFQSIEEIRDAMNRFTRFGLSLGTISPG